MQKRHKIKLQLPYCDDVYSGRKNFEVRLNDRGYQTGDYVQFISVDGSIPVYHPVDKEVYVITYIHSGLGLDNGYVVFGIVNAKSYKSEPKHKCRECEHLKITNVRHRIDGVIQGKGWCKACDTVRCMGYNSCANFLPRTSPLKLGAGGEL